MLDNKENTYLQNWGEKKTGFESTPIKNHFYRFFFFFFLNEETSKRKILVISRNPIKISIAIPIPIQSDTDEPKDRYMHTMVRCCTFDKVLGQLAGAFFLRQMSIKQETRDGCDFNEMMCWMTLPAPLRANQVF